MSKTNKQKELRRGELRSRKRMYKAKRNWVVASATVALGISALGLTSNAQAETWQATTVETMKSRVKAEDGQYTFQSGDTFYAIGNAINIKPEKLMEWNGFAQGTQYSVPVGTVIHWDGNHVTVKDSEGNVVANKVVQDADKIDPNKTIAGQATDTQKNPVVADKNGNVTNAQNSNNSGTSSNSNTSNNSSNNSQVSTNKPNNSNNSSNPVTPENPADKPTDPSKPEVKKFAVTVIYKDQAGNVLGKEADTKVEEGESFTAKAKSFDGFTLVGNATQTVKVTADRTITFTYKANEVTPPTPVEKFNVTINYVDTDGNAIADSDEVSVEKGQEYTAYATTLAGYTLQGAGSQTVTADSDKEVTFVYKKEATPVEKFAVIVKYVDEDGKEIASTDTNEVEKGESFTANAKTIDGFTLQGSTTQTVTVDGNKTVTFTYKKDEVTPPVAQKFDVTVNFVDTDGNEIADKDVVSVEEGQSFTATAKTVEGFTLQGEATQEVTVDGNKTVTFTYTKNVAPVEKFDVTTKFVDESGQEIATSETQEVEKGQVFTAQSKDISGYTLQGASTQTVTVNGNQTVTFTYKKGVALIEKFDVVVYYKDTEGNLLDTDQAVEVEKGASFTANSKVIDGYTLQGNATQTVTVDGGTTITFTYKKDVVAPIVDKSALQTLVTNVQDTPKGNFADDSFASFETNLGVAQQVLADTNATQAEVDSAKANLQTAFDNLAEKTTGGSLSATEIQIAKATILREVNNLRASYGLEPVISEDHLNRGADTRAIEIETLFDHVRPDGSGIEEAVMEQGAFPGIFGENIASNSAPYASGEEAGMALFTQWKNSPDHLSLMLTRQMKYIGIGINSSSTGIYGVMLMSAMLYDNDTNEPLYPDTKTQVQTTESQITNIETTDETTLPTETIEDFTISTDTVEEALEETTETSDEEIATPEDTKVDKSELAQAYNIALGLSEDNYDSHTWSTLAIKIGNAKNVFDDASASQIEANNATNNLINTINNM